MKEKLQTTVERKEAGAEAAQIDPKTTERLIRAVVQASEDVFKSMLRVRITSGKPVKRPINTKGGVSSEICALISFVGDVSGVLMLKCSKKVGMELASRMLGIPVDTESDDLRDAIGELLNIIIGSAKSFYSQENSFKLSIPTTVIGRDFSLYIKANAGETLYYIPLKSGNARIAIELYRV